MKIVRIFGYWLFFLLAVACQFNPSGSPKQTEEKGEEERADYRKQENALEIFQSQFKALGAALGPIEQKSLSDGIQAIGFIRVHNQDKATVTSLFGGRVQHIFVAPGDIVKKGQVLVSLVNPQIITMQEAYLVLINAIALTKLDLDRQRELVEGNAGALKNLQTVQTQFKQQQVKIAALKRQLTLAGINAERLTPESIKEAIAVTAPVSGTISHIHTELGANADAGVTLANIVNNRQVDLDLYIYEKDLSNVKIGQEIEFALSNDAAKKGRAIVDRVGSSFEGENKAIAVHARIIGSREGFFDGMGVSGLLKTGANQVKAVPDASIVDKEGSTYIFTLAETGKVGHGGTQKMRYRFERKKIKKGISSMGFTAIIPIDAIDEKELIATAGAVFLQAKLDGGNAHSH
ncbi:efflux RND transporter periplasmic adaptor subunit [Olivibacter sp. XZL3]|uniref:efflux RND transporter periplasmic adaptor subunit n=1 Tax=Olivibacter sp. XZL3 TaxID=1735116 RepID=UPI0010661A7B|nr:efflux RND transporter periplasmic adaptor subunit [Olivibacter sp. XZL3]